MSNKISWTTILQDFKERHPHLGKQITYWCPCGFLKIDITLKDGMKLIYNYDEHKAVITRTSWQ